MLLLVACCLSSGLAACADGPQRDAVATRELGIEQPQVLLAHDTGLVIGDATIDLSAYVDDSLPRAVPTVSETAIVGVRRDLPRAASIAPRTSARGDSIARAETARLMALDRNRRARSDTIRGVVTVVGTAPATTVTLRVPGITSAVALSGMVTGMLARVSGADVMIRGVRVTTRDMVVSDFVVRSVDGVAALDGRLEARAGAWSLVQTENGARVPLATIPVGLRGKEGSRVWITLTRGRSVPEAYGVIQVR